MNYVQKASISRHFKIAVSVKLLLIILCVCVLPVFIFTQHPFFIAPSIVVVVDTHRIFTAVAFGLKRVYLALMTGALCNWNLLH